MTTLIYKYILGRYELYDVKNLAGEEMRIIFEEPYDGKLTLGDRVFNVTRGVCKIHKSHLQDGELSPKLITSGSIKTLEGFIAHGGAVTRISQGADYARSLASSVDALFKRVAALEAALSEVNKNMNRKLEF